MAPRPNRAGPAVTIVLAVVVAAGGCATTRSAVDKRMLLPERASRYAPTARETFLMAVPIDDRLPSFPAAASRGTRAVTVCADFVVAASGDVEQVAIVHAPAPCDPDASGAASFEAAVRDALAHWSFFGAGVCTFPPGLAKNDTCEGVPVRAVPIRLRYLFTFDMATRGVRARKSAAQPR